MRALLLAFFVAASPLPLLGLGSIEGFAPWGRIRVEWQTVSPAPLPVGHQQISCAVTSAAAGATGYTYEWRHNGTSLGTRTSPWSGSAGARGTQVQCVVTPQGSDGPIGEPAIATFVTADAPPMATAAQVTPYGAVFETSTLACSSNAQDIDGDAIELRYRWFVNGGVIPQTTATLTGVAFDAGDSVSCEASLFQGGYSYGTFTSEPRVINDSPPTITSATVSPSTAIPGTTLTCTPAGAADPDGDTVLFEYRWRISGVEDAASTQVATRSSGFAAGNVVQCKVTARGPGTSPGFGFTGLTGNSVYSNQITILPARVTVAATAGSGGSVTAASSTPGASCSGAACDVPNLTSTVSLTASPASGHRFLRWSGPCQGGVNPATVVNATADVSCAASFVERVQVTGRVEGSGGRVEVTSDARGARCERETCEVDVRSLVTLRANPATGYDFVGWSGRGCDSREPTFTLTASASLTCVATFRAR